MNQFNGTAAGPAAPAPLSPVHRAYLTGHAVTDEVIAWTGIGSDGGLIVFPWADGGLVTYQTRPWPGAPGDYRWNCGVAGRPLHLWAIRPTAPGTGPVIIAEGTKQSLAVASWAPPEYAVYAMQGCRGASKVDLARFAGRQVIVMLDADAGTNPSVYAAGDQLGTDLAAAGAFPCFATAPGRGADKTGLDDWLAGIDPGQRTAAVAGLLAAPRARPADIDPLVASRTAELAAALLDIDGLRRRPLPEPVVDDWLFADSLAQLVGKWGGGKTVAAVDVTGCVVTGQPWHGHKVRQGPVLYLVLESTAGFRQRAEAWEALNGRAMTGAVFLPEPVSLMDGRDAAAMAMLAARLQPVLVVVDTQARAMPGAEENSNTDGGVFVAALDGIRRACGGCVLTVHHMGRSGEHGRGASAIDAAMGTIITAVKDGQVITLHADGEHGGRQKDAPEPPPVVLALKAAGPGLALAVPERGPGSAAYELSGPALTVLGVLRDSGGEESTTSVTELTGLTKATVRRALIELRAANRVARHQVGLSHWWSIRPSDPATVDHGPVDSNDLESVASSGPDRFTDSRPIHAGTGENPQLSTAMIQPVQTDSSDRPTAAPIHTPIRGESEREPVQQHPPAPAPGSCADCAAGSKFHPCGVCGKSHRPHCGVS